MCQILARYRVNNVSGRTRGRRHARTAKRTDSHTVLGRGTKKPDAVDTVKNALVADAGDGKPVQCTHGP